MKNEREKSWWKWWKSQNEVDKKKEIGEKRELREKEKVSLSPNSWIEERKFPKENKPPDHRWKEEKKKRKFPALQAVLVGWDSQIFFIIFFSSTETESHRIRFLSLAIGFGFATVLRLPHD